MAPSTYFAERNYYIILKRYSQCCFHEERAKTIESKSAYNGLSKKCVSGPVHLLVSTAVLFKKGR